MLGNDLIFKCGIPKYVADFVSVMNWIDSEGQSWASRQYGKGALLLNSKLLTMLYFLLGVALSI